MASGRGPALLAVAAAGVTAAVLVAVALWRASPDVPSATDHALDSSAARGDATASRTDPARRERARSAAPGPESAGSAAPGDEPTEPLGADAWSPDVLEIPFVVQHTAPPPAAPAPRVAPDQAAGMARMSEAATRWKAALRDDPAGGAQVAEEVSAALRGDDFWTMRAALAVLATPGVGLEPAPFRDEVAPLLGHAEGGTRVRAAAILARVGVTDADWDVVAQQAAHPSWEVRVVVPMVLVRLSGGEPAGRADEILASLLRGTPPEARVIIVQTLTEVRLGPLAAQALADACRESFDGTFAMSVSNLRSKPHALVTSLLDRTWQTDPRAVRRAVGALAAGVSDADRFDVVARLRTLTAAPGDADVRHAAIDALAAVAPDDARPDLTWIAGNEAEPDRIRGAARAALRRIELR